MAGKVDPETRKYLYLRPFCAANPNTRAPLLTYENGWWCFRNSEGDRYPGRYRTATLERMTQRLAATATQDEGRAYDPDREQRMVEALRGALVVIDTLPWPSEAEAGRKVLDALTKRRAAIVAALAPFNAIEKVSP